MPEAAWTTDYSSYSEPPIEPVAPGWGDIFRAAFSQENDVVAAIRLANEKFTYDPHYNVADSLKEYNISPEERDNYVDVWSADEFAYRYKQVQRERADRETLARSGWAGTAAMIAAGAISPTTFIPLLGQGTKAVQIGKAVAGGFLGAALQEGMLYAEQQTRTPGEVAFSISASTILSGILGGAAAFMKKDVFEKVASDMADEQRALYGGSLSAAEVPREGGAGKFQYVPGIDTMSRLGPVTRGIQQPHAPKVAGVKMESPEYRRITSLFSDAGLRFEENRAGKVAAPGGAIEDEVVTYARNSVEGVEAVGRNFYDYFFDGAAPRFAKGLRTNLARTFGTGTKLNRAEFRNAVTETIWSGETHPIKQVNAAAEEIKTKVFDRMYREAEEVGVYKALDEDQKAKGLMGDAAYAMRDYNKDAIQRNQLKWLDILSGNYEAKLAEEFKARWEKMLEKNKRTALTVEDMKRPQAEAEALLEKFKKEYEDLAAQNLDYVAVDDALARQRRTRKSAETLLGNKLGAADRTSMRDARRKLIANAGPGYAAYKDQQRAIKRRLRGLGKARALLEQRLAKKLTMIESNEQAALDTLARAARQAQGLLSFIREGSPAKVKAAMKQLRDDFEEAAQKFDKNEERLTRLVEQERGQGSDKSAELLAADSRREAIAKKMDETLKAVDDLGEFNRAEWEAAAKEMLDDLLMPYKELIARRAVREQRLLEQARKLTPEAADARIKYLESLPAERMSQLREAFKGKGGEAVDAATGTADFKPIAREIAEQITDKMLARNGRLSWADLIHEKRGPEYARALDIPSMQIKDFLETDIEKLVVGYVRTLGADIALTRKFGSPNAAEAMTRLLDEEKRVINDLATVKSKDGKALAGPELEKAQEQVSKFYAGARNDIETLLMRVRHERGIPQDPRSYGARAARLALNINTARSMGSVLVSSVADVARPVMKFGLGRVFRDGFIPMMTNLKTIRMSQREAQLAGTALDAVLHTRAHAVYDVFDYTVHGSKFEKGVEFLSSHIGLVGAFDYWTSAWKQFTAGLANAKMLDSIETVVTGKGNVAKAREYLAAKNLAEDDIAAIWEQVTTGEGGGKVNGVWLPNTDSWDVSRPEVKKALRAYRSALVSEVDDTIVTPGLERPSWVDSNVPAKLLAQFKSFGLSSTTKTLMAGLQQRDAAFLNGVMVSLAFGAISYYLWAVSTGGEAYTTMQNAGLDKWMDEAISRSGVMGVFDEMQRVGQATPLRPYLSLSGTQATRREGGDLVEALGGPTLDLANRMGQVVVSADKPTQRTLHQARTILPYQNVFWLRRLLDVIEEKVGKAANLPERAN